MRNPGHPPYEADEQTVLHGPIDIRFRNGRVVRHTDARLWRWTLGDPAFPPEWDFDIVDWQPS